MDRPASALASIAWPWLQQLFGLAFIATLIVGITYFPWVKQMPIGYVPVVIGLVLACVALNRRVAYRIETLILAISKRRFLLYVIALAIALRIAAVLLSGTIPVSDHEIYHGKAVSMLRGNGYGSTAFFPPGMSFWLLTIYAIFGESVLAAQMVNAAIGGVLTWLTYDVARHIVPESAARLAAILAAFFPSLVVFAATLGYEPLLGCLILLAMSLFLRRAPARSHPMWHVALIGVVLGAVAFVKPIGLLAPGIFTLCYWRHGTSIARSIRNGLILAIFLFATIAPWTMRNHRVLGEFVPVTTSSGVGLWMTNHEGATALNEPLPALPSGITELERNRLLWKQSWAYIFAHPDRFVRMLPAKAAYLWGTSSTVMAAVSADRWDPINEAAAKCAINIAWTFIAVLFISAVWRDGFCRSTVAFWPMVSMLAYLWGIHLFYEAQSRYHLAFLPILLIGAAAGLLRHRPHDLSAEPSCQ